MENRSWRVSAIVCVCAALWCVLWSIAFWKSDATEPQAHPNQILQVPELGAISKDTSRRVRAIELEQWAPGALMFSHLLWTPAMLAERYGAPDQIGASDGTSRWHYQIGKKTLSFGVIDGVVTDTYLQ